MLDYETKKNIDDARDILVGKIPDPKSQVEQITIALIYKFMGDIDQKARDLGSKAKFFTGEYEKYSWSNIFDPSISGFELVSLYGEALQKMSLNDKIPALFRSIFKNAYLPYRDPDTLKSFLKAIDKFNYNHSENLGNAYEYLLSVMGAQGDAGQFRTPRHIIDFIVDAVDPSERDTILDPACGTAGFLISAYKHIISKNTDEKGNITLSSEQKKKLYENFVGYDISPDMIRISLVNLYLHNFKDPKIYEYDTLTSEDRWDERFDVILANPPFMTPKGGIKPHNRFGVQANRSEVLFVDYISEHLNPNGRAGIIVPEGIIFQSGNAYKKLRELLVKDYLYAVVSLPAGVFNPYSGVKTSILLLDKKLAKQTKDILFVKISNDGRDLGAQRRETKENDLPLALEIIKKYKNSILQNKILELAGLDQTVATIVLKEKLAQSEEYNLSADRYKEEKVYAGKWPLIELGEICDIFNGSTPLKTNKEYWCNGDIPWFTIDDIREQGRIINKTSQSITSKALNETSIKLLPVNTVLLCCTASVGEFAITNIELTTNQQFNGLVIKKEYSTKLLAKYLFVIASVFKEKLDRLGGTTAFKFVSIKDLKSIKIPLPPVEIQEKIVEELESYQNVVDGAKKVIDYYKPRFKINSEWEIVKFEDVIETITPPIKILKSDYQKIGKYPIIDQSQEAVAGWTNDTNFLVNITKPVVIFGDHTCVIKYMESKFAQGADGIKILNTGEKLHPKYLYYYLIFNPIIVEGYNRHFSKLKAIKISIPPMDIQKQIISQIEDEERLVESNKKLIEIFNKKIKDKISEIWGE